MPTLHGPLHVHCHGLEIFTCRPNPLCVKIKDQNNLYKPKRVRYLTAHVKRDRQIINKTVNFLATYGGLAGFK